MVGNRPLELVADGLRNITLPSLRRPPVKPNEDPTEELVQWGTKVYVYSVIAHIRAILSGLVQLAQVGNIPASYIVSRHILEWAAHACYMSRNLKNYFQRKEWRRAWRVLTSAVTGNLWARKYGAKYGPGAQRHGVGVPGPLKIANLISAYEEYRSQQFGTEDAKDDYSLLSEHSHPNSACLQQYHEYSPDGRDLHFGDPAPVSSLPFVNRCLIDLLLFIDELLRLSNDTSVRPRVHSLLTELAKLARAIRT